MKKELVLMIVIIFLSMVFSLSCSDDSGGSGTGTLCENIDCSGHGTCVVVDNEAMCECDPCYKGAGLTCIRESIEVDSIDEDTVWKSYQDVQVTSSLFITNELVIEACATVNISSEKSIYIQENGVIKSEGSEEYPIIFSSAKENPAAGDWNYIEISSEASSGNTFNHTQFKHGGGNNYGVIYIYPGPSVAIDNCTFSNIANHAIQLEDTVQLESFTYNTFDAIEKELMILYADSVISLDPIIFTGAAVGAHPILIEGGTTTKDGVWKDLGVPYHASYALYIENSIEIEKGTELYMGAGRSIYIRAGGELKTKGTIENPVLISSAKPSPAAGDWNYIEIASTASAGNEFTHTTFEYGGGNNYGMLYLDQSSSAKIDNCQFENSISHGLELKEDVVITSFSENSFDAIGTDPIIAAANTISQLEPITLENSDGNVVISGGTISTESNWKNLNVPYQTDGSLWIEAPLSVEKGTTLHIGIGNSLYVREGGNFVLEGTANEHVTITSSKPTPSAGDWDYIEIDGSASAGSRFTYTDISYGGLGGYGQLHVGDGAEITLENVAFTEGKTCDVSGDGTVNSSNSTYIVCPE